MVWLVIVMLDLLLSLILLMVNYKLHKRIKRCEDVVQDVNIDVRAYDQLKQLGKAVTQYANTINKVGTWKK